MNYILRTGGDTPFEIEEIKSNFAFNRCRYGPPHASKPCRLRANKK